MKRVENETLITRLNTAYSIARRGALRGIELGTKKWYFTEQEYHLKRLIKGQPEKTSIWITTEDKVKALLGNQMSL